MATENADRIACLVVERRHLMEYQKANEQEFLKTIENLSTRIDTTQRNYDDVLSKLQSTEIDFASYRETSSSLQVRCQLL